MRAPENMLNFDAVTKRYGGKTVLHDVSLGVEAGECVALVGHNGAGKTTLIKLVLGLTRPSAGRVRLQGEDPAGGSAVGWRGSIGFLPENVAFHGAMTGREVLSFYAKLKGLGTSGCDELLERFGLADARNQRFGTYSKGMRQRLGLAQAVIGRPRLLLFDEPTSGLDPMFRRTFYELLSSEKAAGATAFISSHALTEIEARADRVAIMKQGRIIACGTLDGLRRAANLPIRVRVSVTPGDAGRVAEEIHALGEVRSVNSRSVDLTCAGGDKMTVVRHLASLGDSVCDVDIHPPMLEEIYEHYAADGGAL
jgi:Cu-processing system ATP-binding protein